MKKIIIMAFAILSFALISCEKETNDNNKIKKVQEINNDNYIVELYTETGKLQTGYNEIFIKVKEKNTGNYIKNININWYPEMQMMDKKHSCPRSSVEKVDGETFLQKGYIIFQMAGNAMEHWNLTITLNDGEQTIITEQINVQAATYKNVATFKDTISGKKYVIALIQPQKPTVATNDLSFGLFEMESMSNFLPVTNFTILFDPRMPSMENHSSPNNTQPSYNNIDGFYQGKLSLTMTGEWKLNLIIKNAVGDIIQGNVVTNTEDSNLYLMLEAK